MPYTSNLWLSNATHRVFGWKEILEEWDQTLNIPTEVKRVKDNLCAATDPDDEYNPRLSQFLTYLNYEQEGIVWFLYACITMRWMYGDVRLDYIRSLVDEIEDLDANFPIFHAFPQGMTIRQFVDANLSGDELNEVQMMPPLVAVSPEYETPRRPTRSARADYSYAQQPIRRSQFRPISPLTQPVPEVHRKTLSSITATLSQRFEALERAALEEKESRDAAQKLKLAVQIHFIRNKDESNDDIIKITQNSSDSYNIVYLDKDASVKSKTLDVPRDAVINLLSMTLRLLTIDEEPFQSVQITIPSMPTIILSPKNITSQTRDLIYESVEATMNYWPTCVKV
jgi:hypothetical protein